MLPHKDFSENRKEFLNEILSNFNSQKKNLKFPNIQ